MLLHELPLFTGKTLDNNIWHFVSGAGLEYEDISALHNHLVSSSASTVRVEFQTEQKAQTFLNYMRNSKKYWKVPDQSDTRLRAEQDVPTDDRISMQPYFALLDILGELEDESNLQVWRQTLQIWASKQANEQPLLAQVAYVLDARYPRRYCCLLLLCEKHYDSILDRWHTAFSKRMQQTMMLIQALRRAVIDKTTTSRASYDKAFDVSNVAFHHNSFPYPIFPMKIGRDLATLLESHLMLPFQGAGGLLSITQQAFQDYGVNSGDFGKGAAKGKGSKARPSGKGSSLTWGKGSVDFKDCARTPKGKSSGKGSWKERDHDSRTDWRKNPDDDQDDWGSRWKQQGNWGQGKGWHSNRQSQCSNQGSKTRTRTPPGKGKNNQYSGASKSPQLCSRCRSAWPAHVP